MCYTVIALSLALKFATISVHMITVGMTVSFYIQTLAFWLILSLAADKLQALDKTSSTLKPFFLLAMTIQLIALGMSFSKNSVIGGNCSPYENEKPIYPYTLTTIQCV